MHATSDLPQPAAAALRTSHDLSARIAGRIGQAGGSIPFSEYMEMCLYEPGLGYYSAGARKFGAGGDFITAPEVSPLFGRCLARCAAAVLAETGGDVLEFGAGSGRLAVDMLGELDVTGGLPGRYFILERSATLRGRQQELIAQQVPDLLDRVEWLDALPADFAGLVVANEVLDAMACERFRWDGEGGQVYHVAGGNDGFGWQLHAPGDALAATISTYAAEYEFTAGYESELNPSLDGWLSAVAGMLTHGLVLLIDYGYTRREYFHPQRRKGTLQCHYRQHVHDDPFFLPGLQDITAHVDFTAVAEAAVDAGLEVRGYTTQSFFLADCDLDRLLQQAGPGDSIAYLQLAQQAKTLVLPGEMGERFQCIGLAQGLDTEVPGFRLQDMRGRL